MCENWTVCVYIYGVAAACNNVTEKSEISAGARSTLVQARNASKAPVQTTLRVTTYYLQAMAMASHVLYGRIYQSTPVSDAGLQFDIIGLTLKKDI